MKAIAKYLPVDDGVPRLCAISTDVKDGDMISWELADHFHLNGFHTAKAIALGDKVWGVYASYGQDMIPKDQAYKILGKINDAAKWVKEGDEIEVEIVLSDWLMGDDGELAKWAEVKCPCCEDYK